MTHPHAACLCRNGATDSTNSRSTGPRHVGAFCPRASDTVLRKTTSSMGNRSQASRAVTRSSNRGRLKQLYAQGNVSLRSGGAPVLDSIVATNYVKPGDSVTFTFNRAQKAVVGIQVRSYLSGPPTS